MAIHHFSKAIELNPNYGDAIHNLANIYFEVGMLEEAEQAYSRALEINPRIWQTWQNLGITYLNMGDKQKALEHIEMAGQLNPESVEIQRMIIDLRQQLAN